MKTWRLCLTAVAAMFCALMLSPGATRADDLTGSVGISWLYPDTGTAFATDAIAVGSTIACPGASPICVGYGGDGSEAFTVGPTSISYSASDYPGGYAAATFNGFDFTGLAFASTEPLGGFTLTTDIPGLTSSDVTFGSDFIEVNLEGLITANGDFTLTLIPGTGTVATPEPSSLILLGAGLLALVGFTRRRQALARRFRNQAVSGVAGAI